jgi:hypothetical protein
MTTNAAAQSRLPTFTVFNLISANQARDELDMAKLMRYFTYPSSCVPSIIIIVFGQSYLIFLIFSFQLLLIAKYVDLEMFECNL